MRFASLVLCVLSSLACTQARADDPAPAPVPAPEKPPATAPTGTARTDTARTDTAPVPKSPPAQKPAAARPDKPSAASDEEEPAPKSAPRRFVPTDKGKADEDIPFPVDI